MIIYGHSIDDKYYINYLIKGGKYMSMAFSFTLLLIYIPLFILSIYCLVLFIKLAHRGIKALDIYIEKNKNY